MFGKRCVNKEKWPCCRIAACTNPTPDQTQGPTEPEIIKNKQQHEKTLQQLSIVITTNFWHITSAMWHCLELLVEATEVML